MKAMYRMGSDLSELAKASDWLRQIAEEHLIGPKEIYALDLALEEIVTNVLKYGFLDGSGTGAIEIIFEIEEGCARLRIADCGCAFNPLDAPEPVLQKDVKSMKIGGLGIHLTRQIMDGMEYERINHRNILTIWKNLP